MEDIFSIAIVNDEVKLCISALPQENFIVIYEVMRVINGKILFFEDHLTRFCNSMSLAGFSELVLNDLVIRHLKLLITATGVENGNIKFQWIYQPAIAKADFNAFFIPQAYPSEAQYKQGVSVAIMEAQRQNPQAKMLQAVLRETMNRQIAHEKVYEILMLHPDGYITEGSRSNVFMIKNNVVFTAPLGDILPGVTRKYVLEICNKNQFTLIEKRVNEAELFAMDAVFLTGTSPKVLPISNIKEQSFDVDNLVLRRIMKSLDELIADYLNLAVKISG